jgi:hypothetical protein
LLADYCSVDDTKEVLHIKTEVTSEDAKLAECVTSASVLLDNFLLAKNLAVPSSVPILVKDATANFAGWEYRKVQDPEGAETLWVAANRLLEAYIGGILKTNSDKATAEIAKLNAETDKLKAETALLTAETPTNESYVGVA